MKILFVMDKRVDRGSIQAIANYIRAGDELGCSMALYGRAHPQFPFIRFSTDLDAFDYVVFVVESWFGFMSGLRMPRIMAKIERERRAILDADGMFCPPIVIDRYDRNHEDADGYRRWRAHYGEITDKVMQPTYNPSLPEVIPLPFYGYDPKAVAGSEQPSSKSYDVLHVGHNWWRWRQISEQFLPEIEGMRPDLSGICFQGLWWDAPPAGAKDMNLEIAFGSDPSVFERLRIEVRPPVPYTEVIAAMSRGRVNVMTQRPLFQHLKLLTSKYFEIFAADTIPLVMIDEAHATQVYGDAGAELVLNGNIAAKLSDALARPRRYREIVAAVREHLHKHHSYRGRVQDLVQALQCAAYERVP